jgi:hypothetical protein
MKMGLRALSLHAFRIPALRRFSCLNQQLTSVPHSATRDLNKSVRRDVIGPIEPEPIIRPSTFVTQASSPIVPVQKHSSAL